jgi:hypothetical protein
MTTTTTAFLATASSSARSSVNTAIRIERVTVRRRNTANWLKADRVTFGKDAVRYAGETHITDSACNLLRLDPQGNFRSLYRIK